MNAEHYGLIRQGATAWNAWRDENPERPDLSYANLRGANLVGADFSGADLSYTYLCYAHLGEAKFVGADLSRANLSYAHLRGADFTDADLTDAGLIGANLSYAHFTGAALCKADLGYADLTGADLTGADLTGAWGLALTYCNHPSRGPAHSGQGDAMTIDFPAEAKRLHDTGFSRRQVAAELGVSYQVACLYLREANVPAWPNAGPKRITLINSLLLSGMRQSAIARRLDLTPERIRQIRVKHGLPKRME